jgi:hypothetical protein
VRACSKYNATVNKRGNKSRATMGKDKPAKGDAKKAPEAKPEEKKSSSPANEAKKEGKKDAKKKK